MAQDINRHLSIPEGTEGLSFAEAYRHRSVVRIAEDLFTSWGYLPAQLPVIDYFDSYRSLLSDEALRSVYRLVDRNGDLLMLRSDVTLFLAKHLGAHTGKTAGPVRISYSDTILRYQESEDISHNEFYQLGAELIGIADLRGDVEIAALLGELIKKLGVPEPVLHIGSRALFDKVTRNIPSSDRMRAVSCIVNREWDEFRSLTGIDGSLFAFIGSLYEFSAFCAELTDSNVPGGESAGVEAEIETLDKMAGTIDSLDVPFDVRIDLSEIGTQSYYTGCVFSVYIDGAATAIASGGRYDDLLQHFGDRRPAVGFSLMLRKVMQKIADNPRLDPPLPTKVHESDIISALTEAMRIRAEGGVSEL